MRHVADMPTCTLVNLVRYAHARVAWSERQRSTGGHAHARTQRASSNTPDSRHFEEVFQEGREAAAPRHHDLNPPAHPVPDLPPHKLLRR